MIHRERTVLTLIQRYVFLDTEHILKHVIISQDRMLALTCSCSSFFTLLLSQHFFHFQIQAFTNHACDADNNIGYNLTVSQTTADPKEVTREIIEKYEGRE